VTVATDVPVSIVVPVYRGVDEVRRCIESVVRHTAAGAVAAELVLIDDASPEPEVSALLVEVAAAPPDHLPVTLLVNDENLGFVGTVNRGLRRAAGDVVVLNADTVVTAGWLDRLADAADEPDVATVTPLTGFGSLATLPARVRDAFDLDGTAPRIDECAAFIAREGLGMRPEVISGVGFCLYVTREALDAVGLLDEETFGRGYGEEVDFCLRASRVGFRHLVEDRTFVHHQGGVSFAEERTESMARASSLLHDRYRFFRAANTRERREDPLAVPFAALELGLAPRRTDRPHVLQVLHSGPGALGGTEKHLHALLVALADEFDFSILHPVESGFVLRTFWTDDHGTRIEHELLLPGAPRRVTRVHDDVAGEAMRTALEMFDFDAVHVQNLIGHSLAALEVLREFPGPVVCSVRDLYLACPHHWLLYRNRAACGIPEDLSACARCLPETQRLPIEYLREFREVVADRLDAVDHWVFASRSAGDYLLRAYDLPDERVHVIPHGAIIPPGRATPAVDEGLLLDEPLRLAFVGLGWMKKGLHVVNDLLEDLAGSSVEVHHFGELKDRAHPDLVLHGRYDNAVLPELLHLAGAQVVLLPGPYAETFGHVMTEALITGLPVIGARYGALGERIRAAGVGWTVDPADREEVATLVRNLDRDRHEVLRVTRRVRDLRFVTVAATAERYAELYRGGAPATGPSGSGRRATTGAPRTAGDAKEPTRS
jgi:GT2 family glycosyltransferase/glycosyltransferase involved in cell wall biosynthesis